MRRGFLNKPTTKTLRKPLQEPLPESKALIKIPTGRATPRDDVPSAGNIPHVCTFTVTTLPFPETRELRTPEPFTICVLYPGIKEALSTIPGFPKPYNPDPKKLYRIESVEGAGYGVLSSVDFDIGDRIMLDRPILSLPQAMPPWRPGVPEEYRPENFIKMIVQYLEPPYREDFYKLHNCKDSSMLEGGIINTNALPLGALPGKYSGMYAGVCLDLSRVNHSCTPNAFYFFDLQSLTYELRAIKPIKRDEQIFIHYLSSILEPRAARQKELSSKYSFVCCCPSCSLGKQDSLRSDAARALLQRDLPNPEDNWLLKQWINDPSLPADHVIAKSKKILDVMFSEGLVHEEIWPAHIQRICKAYCALEELDAAREWAKKAEKLTYAFTGKDGGWTKVVSSPQETDWWGLRKKTAQNANPETKLTNT